MKMMIYCLALLFVITSSVEAVDTLKMQIGRYQIIPVEYNSFRLNGEKADKAVLKIDTSTGETWILTDVVGKIEDGRTISNRGWEKLEISLSYELKGNILIMEGTK